MVLSRMHADGCVKVLHMVLRNLSSQHTIEVLLLSWLLPVSIHVPMHTILCTSYELRHVACLHHDDQHAWRCGPALRMEQADLLNCLNSTLPEH